jgi:hypothetical protein
MTIIVPGTFVLVVRMCPSSDLRLRRLHAIEASQPSLASHSDIFGQACALALVIVRASRYDLKDMTCAGCQSLPEITLTEGAAYIVFAGLECRSTDVHTT